MTQVEAPAVDTKRHHPRGCARSKQLTSRTTKRWEHVTCGSCRRMRKGLKAKS